MKTDGDGVLGGAETGPRAGRISRRAWLRGTGCAAGCAAAAASGAWPAVRAAAASAALVPAPAAPADAVSPVMARLSEYMGAAGDRALPAEIVEATKQHVLDTVASMISGSALAPGRAAIKFARAYGGTKVATVVGSNVECGAIEAAMANGVLAQADETDDTHAASLSHPGCAVVPAALAAGEQFGIGGERFLRAVTLGYDVGPRMTMTLGGTNYATETHRATHAISANFGAAAAAACAAKLDAAQMRAALDYTAQQCSGLVAWQRDTEHIEKAFVFGGMGARNGVTTALIVESGWTGVDDIFSGADNFFDGWAPQANREGLVDKLGERYEVTRTSIKKWTVGSPIQAPLDAIALLQKQHPFSAADVAKVIVRSPTDEARTVDNRAIPDICLQHMVAVMLIDKTASFRAAHDLARMQDPAILKQRAKVTLVGDAELQKLLPARVAIVVITLTDGRQLTQRVDAVRGTPQNPMGRDEVVSKARDLMEPVLGAATSGKLIERLLTLETLKNVRELRPLLQHA